MSQIYEHHDPLNSSLLPALITHLPHSISLLRRIQHGLAHPAPTAKILATFPPSGPQGPTWLAARVDLFRGRETQIILYSSLEACHTSIQPIDGPGPKTADSFRAATLLASPAERDTAREQLLALLRYVKATLLPTYLAWNESNSHPVPASNGVALIPAPDPRAFLIGTLHTGLYALLLESGVFPAAGENENHHEAKLLPGLKVHRYDNPPYDKFFFSREVLGDGEEVLPAGYRFHDASGRRGVLDSQLDLVQSRTHIPRSRAQLSLMPGVAIYVDEPTQEGEEMPIAWAFLGMDGALSSLFVEEEHRGRGLALPLTRETIRRGMDPEGVFGVHRLGDLGGELGEELGAWVHTEVAQYNPSSRRVMQKAGGQVLSTVMWTVVELCD